MASKKFKGKTCAYCGKAGISAAGDHVFARGFFLGRCRQQLPEVPACDRCNNEKSKLETYLLQIMPLGANHTDAQETCDTLMPKRAKNPGNKVLRQCLERPYDAVLLTDDAGRVHERIPVLVDTAKLTAWCGLVARGLAFFHWRVATPDYEVEAVPLSAEVERDILSFAEGLQGGKSVEKSVGNGAFKYRGFKCADGEAASMWIIQLYGAMPIGGDPAVSRACAASWGVFVTPRDGAVAAWMAYARRLRIACASQRILPAVNSKSSLAHRQRIGTSAACVRHGDVEAMRSDMAAAGGRPRRSSAPATGRMNGCAAHGLDAAPFLVLV